jgi:thiamine pyrophosphate-dependent acetolactate synthase large subunit-like protein
MAAVVHDIVGLQHASMAIFNAFCDRVPLLVLGATGPMDTTRRRPWIDWIHTALVQGTQVRDYVKLDDQPASVAAIPEAFLRAWRLARTEPQGPVYLCLDADLQEQTLEGPVAMPDVARFQPATPPHADPRSLEDAARRLAEARYPVIVVESLGRRPGVAAPLCRLAELLAAPLVDLAVEYQGRPSVPGRHPLDMSGARDEVVREADLILALDVTNVLGAPALGLAARASLRRQRGRGPRLRAARRPRRGPRASRVGEALRQPPGRRRPALRGERALHRRAPSAAAPDRHVQQPDVRQ